MAIVATQTSSHVLSQEILDRCYQRAPIYDRENRFFQEDFEELREAGYLTMAVPQELGGRGLSLAEVCREQRNLAYYAHATALAVNMHLYWTGIAADLWRAGDKSLEWLLKEAVAGEVFAAGYAESGNDLTVILSTTEAEQVEGGYQFTGRKHFGTLSPVWTRLGIGGMDTSDPQSPKIVHGFMPRDTQGFTIVDTWDVMGMRATCSQDTMLDGVYIPDKYIARVLPAGNKGADHFILAMFAWALMGFANVYYGLARRAYDITLEGAKKRSSIGLTRPSMAYHPAVQRGIAQMVMELEAIEPHIEKIAQDWSNGVDYGHEWPSKIVTAKYRAVEGAWRVVDQALETSGGFGIFRKSGLERLFRDARLGRIHPANTALTEETVAKTALGLDPDEQPRWG
jgi:alkylation response protein AidB-like acyl-CoA dehydrogenase